MITTIGVGGFFAILFESWMVAAGMPCGTSGASVGCGFALVLMIGTWMTMSNNDRERREADIKRAEEDWSRPATELNALLDAVLAEKAVKPTRPEVERYAKEDWDDKRYAKKGIIEQTGARSISPVERPTGQAPVPGGLIGMAGVAPSGTVFKQYEDVRDGDV